MMRKKEEPRGGRGKGFWDWRHYILTKILSGVVLGALLVNAESTPVRILGGLVYLAVIIYGLATLAAVLLGCFAVLPKTQYGQDLLEAEREQRKKEDELLNEYGKVDRED